MPHTGLISKINSDLGYGFIDVLNLGKVFFSEDTAYADTTFSKLEVGMKVTISTKETKRGLFAESLSISKAKLESPSKNSKEATL